MAYWEVPEIHIAALGRKRAKRRIAPGFPARTPWRAASPVLHLSYRYDKLATPHGQIAAVGGTDMHRKFWWIGILALATLGAVGFAYIGIETYRTAPPLPSFTDGAGGVVIPRATILHGQQLFQRYALMNFGSIFGDGAGRGPDFTADALRETARTMREVYGAAGAKKTDWDVAAAAARVNAELKRNTYDSLANTVALSEGQLA